MDVLPIELIVTFLHYCTDKTKTHLLKASHQNVRYHHFFLMATISKASYPLIISPEYMENHQKMLCHTHHIRTILLTHFFPKNLSIKTLKLDGTSPYIRDFPHGITGLIIDNYSQELPKLPKTIRQICCKHVSSGIMNCLLATIESEMTEIETLVIENCSLSIDKWIDNRKYPKLKKLSTHYFLFVFAHGWPESLQYLRVDGKLPELTYNTFPSNLRKLKCHDIDQLFPQIKLEMTNISSLHTNNYITNIHDFYFDKTIEIKRTFLNKITNLTISICDVIKHNIDMVINLKKLIIEESCCYSSYSHKHKYHSDSHFQRIMNHVPIIIVKNSVLARHHPLFVDINKKYLKRQNTSNEDSKADYYLSNVDISIMYIKFIKKEVKDLRIIIYCSEIYLPNSIVKLTIKNTHGRNNTVRLPNSLKYLKVINNENLTLENVPRKLLYLNYSQGVKVNIPSKIIVF